MAGVYVIGRVCDHYFVYDCGKLGSKKFPSIWVSIMNEYDIFILGVNHKVASLDMREKAAYSEEERRELLQQLSQNEAFSEVCILSTCNRSEIYVAAEKSTPVREILAKIITRVKPELSPEELGCFYFYRGKEVMRHLFRVTAGLDSMILGEPQIQGQVKDAVQYAAELGTLGVFFHRLFDMAFQAAKRVRTETAIGEGAVSVAYAAVELSQKIFKDLSRQKVLLIGSGDTGQLVARHLKTKGVENLFIANRTFEKAQALSKELGGIAYPFPLLKELLPEIDLVIGATNAPDYILSEADMRQVLPCRSTRPLL